MLTQLPGVGEFTALVILAEIGEVTRFPSARKLAAWAGLTPTVRGSDLVVRHGHISKQGSAWLRWILCEAAQTAKRHPDFAGTYQAISKRRGKKIATTAVARKLLTRAYRPPWVVLLAGLGHHRRTRPTAPNPRPRQHPEGQSGCRLVDQCSALAPPLCGRAYARPPRRRTPACRSQRTRS